MKTILIVLGIGLASALPVGGGSPVLPAPLTPASIRCAAILDAESPQEAPPSSASPAEGSETLRAPDGKGRRLPHIDFKSRFKGVDGCFVIRSLNEGWTLRYNEVQCAERLAPCSTFKIFNALAGLDAGVLTGADHFMKWDGQKRSIKAWNQDHTLATAMRDSVVWYFQNVAGQIGAERMQKYIDACGYGNEDTSGGIREFWLMNSMKISADEQVQFLEKLYTNKLPFDSKAVKTVKSIIELRSSDDWVFSGKTGSGMRNRKDSKDGELILGWFVGHVKRGDEQYVFAVNLKGKDVWGSKARAAAEGLLADMGLIDAPTK